jgi:hypothetical protein
MAGSCEQYNKNASSIKGCKLLACLATISFSVTVIDRVTYIVGQGL